jgi:tyrosine-protein phosphatase non-receptor type 1
MEQEIKAMSNANSWNQLFMEVRRDSASPGLTTVEACRVDNRPLNRYRDVYPYDHSRVKLEGLKDTDYINASLVKAPRANRQYILAQGPLPSTVGHFWLTVWQQRSKAVLMLNRTYEKGQLKCHQYWPDTVGDRMSFSDVGLELETLHSVPGGHYTVRKFRLTEVSSGESRDIEHFHYTTWPDFGVPACPDTFLEFLAAVRDSGSLDADVGPPVVHCSAGIGRSGTFVLVDTCLVLVAKEGADSVSIRDVLLELRNYRMGLIQTPDQLKFSYLAIAEGARQEGSIQLDIMADYGEQNPPALPSDDSEDDDDDDQPPPLPPPRSESLLRTCGANAAVPAVSDDQDEDYEANANHVNNAPNGNDGEGSSSGSCGTADASSSSSSSPDSDFGKDGGKKETLSAKSSNADAADPSNTEPNKCILNNHKMEERKREMELRRRRKEESRFSTESKITDMKRKAKEADAWQRTKASLVHKVVPFCVGLAMVSAAGVYYYAKNYN